VPNVTFVLTTIDGVPLAPQELTDLERAREQVLERAAPLAAEAVPLDDALGRTLAEPVTSAEPVPGFDNSTMDGFALRAGDTAAAREAAPAELRIAGESRAGHPATATLAPGEAFRISTGAPIPAGADAVVPIEATLAADGRVRVGAAVEPGTFIRRAGGDIAAGATVLGPGAHLGPAELGVLASIGQVAPRCHRRPRVAVLTSGDELLAPGAPARPGGVRDSNGHSVPALARAAGAELTSVETVADEAAATRAAIEPMLEADVAVICGGVSVGEHDHVKGALAELGVEQVFWGVALRPGKPTWFGVRGATLVFGLPGNPVSAMVTFLLLVRPALAVLGGGRPERTRTTAILDRDYEKASGRAHAVRCALTLREDGWHAEPAPHQGSHILTSMLGADCLAILPAASGSARAGDRVEVELSNRHFSHLA
jgi:molybdopterin molybdotransferase